MTETPDRPQPSDRSQSSTDNRLARRAITVVVVVVVAVLVWLIGAAVLPRWWAQRIGNLVDGRITAGTVFGLCTGAVFVVLPLTVLAVGWRVRRGWRRMVKFVVAAVVLAGPNLATLGIVLGSGNAAHAGQRILDVDGPGFRGGSLVGAVIGAAAFAAVASLSWSRTRNRRRAKELKGRLEER